MVRRKESEYVLLRDIVIPAGAVFKTAPDGVQRGVPHKELLVGIGPDTCGSLVFSEEEILMHPDRFRRICDSGVDLNEG